MALDTHAQFELEADDRKARFLRRLKVRRKRISVRERRRLGLPLGVGLEPEEIERARFYALLERVLADEVEVAELTPLQRIGLDGYPRTVEVCSDPDDLIVDHSPWMERSKGMIRPDGAIWPRPPVRRNTSASPLEYLFLNRKSLVHWQYVAGLRFRYDYHLARTGAPMVANLDNLSLTKVHKLTTAERKALRLKPVTFHPKKASIVHGPPAPVADAKLDAISRLGRLADEISKMSFYLLEQVVGRERLIGDVAASIEASSDYIGGRFAESLTEAADHYAKLPSSRPRRR